MENTDTNMSVARESEINSGSKSANKNDTPASDSWRENLSDVDYTRGFAGVESKGEGNV